MRLAKWSYKLKLNPYCLFVSKYPTFILLVVQLKLF